MARIVDAFAHPCLRVYHGNANLLMPKKLVLICQPESIPGLVSIGGWLHIYGCCLPIRRRSPISVLTILMLKNFAGQDQHANAVRHTTTTYLLTISMFVCRCFSHQRAVAPHPMSISYTSTGLVYTTGNWVRSLLTACVYWSGHDLHLN